MEADETMLEVPEMKARQKKNTWCVIFPAMFVVLAAIAEPQGSDVARPASARAPAAADSEVPGNWPPGMKRTVSQVFALFPDADREAVMGFIREQLPNELRRLRQMSERQVGDAFGFTIDLVQDSLRMLEMKKDNPALYEKVVQRRNLERLADDLAAQYRRSAGSERQENEIRLRRTLTQCFEIKQELMRRDLAQMEKELGQLRTLIEKREASRIDIINRRLHEVTGKTDHLGW
jgi:hypothetical protein